MIYMVEHVFSLPELEREWNEWYTAQIRIMLGVPGIRSAQRFRSLAGASPPRYMAMYNFDSPAVFDSAPYKQIGGGGTWSERFRPAYQVWVRNLFDAPGPAPAIGDGQGILVRDAGSPDGGGLAGGKSLWLEAVALHKTTPYRELTVLDAETASRLAGEGRGVAYQPTTACFTAS
jgi:hypothetical protein